MTSIDDFWARCRAHLAANDPGSEYRVRRIGNAQKLSESLLGLITSGEKTGLFSNPDEIQPRPATGDIFVFTDFEGRPRCAVQLREARLIRFADVGPAETACESPAARDVAAWRDIHGRYWQRIREAEGGTFSEEMPLLFQRFEVIYAEPPPAG